MAREPKTLEDWHIAIAGDPGNSAAYRGRGIAYALLGQPEHALADFSTAIQLGPPDAANYRERGTVYGQLGQVNSAIADLDTAIQWDKNDVDAFYRRAMLHILHGDRERAKSDLLDVLWIDPQHLEARYQLGLILGEPAPHPQGEREGALSDECFLSHWGLDGLKPYMRYSLVGGYQANAENVAGSSYCPSRSTLYAPVSDINRGIEEAMEGWMDSPGHREAILDPWARKVNIGLEWGMYNFTAVQQFEGDYVEYALLPTLEGTTLTVVGRLKNGMSFDSDEELDVLIFYDPPPATLTKGQVVRTYCYDAGVPVATVREPPPRGSYYEYDESDEIAELCPSPFDVRADSPVPESVDEAGVLWRRPRAASLRGIEREVPVLHITASRWVAQETSFSVRANIVAVTNRHGPGVYTVAIITETGGDEVLLSQYSLFYKTVPPS